jgi:hypothetical protein
MMQGLLVLQTRTNPFPAFEPVSALLQSIAVR